MKLLVNSKILKPGTIDFLDYLFQRHSALFSDRLYVVNINGVVFSVEFSNSLVKYQRKKAPGHYHIAVLGDKLNGGFSGTIYDVLGTLYFSPYSANLPPGFFKKKSGDKARIIKEISTEETHNWQVASMGAIKNEGQLTQQNAPAHAKEMIFEPGLAFILMKKAALSLRDYIDFRLSASENREMEFLQITHDMLKAYQEQVAKRHIIHRDIKPGNIMFIDAQRTFILFIDWGFALKLMPPASFFKAAMDQRPGTPGYVAPEIYCKGLYSERSDLFALGIAIVELWGFKFNWDLNQVECQGLEMFSSFTGKTIEKITKQMTVFSVTDRSCRVEKLIDYCTKAIEFATFKPALKKFDPVMDGDAIVDGYIPGEQALTADSNVKSPAKEERQSKLEFFKFTHSTIKLPSKDYRKKSGSMLV